MIQRTTFTALVQNALDHLSATLRELGRLHQQALTGKKLQRSSDDPVKFHTAQVYRSRVEHLTALGNNLRDVRLTLQTSSSALQNISSIIARARSLAIEAVHGSQDPNSLHAIAQEIDGLLGQLLDQVNSRTPDHYVFAGTRSNAAPFVAERDGSGRIVRVRYVGDEAEATAAIGEADLVRYLYSGAEVFQPGETGPAVVIGQTGLAVGNGTSSLRGRVAVTVQHTATTYAPGSGVLPGASSPTGDTVLGPSGAHTLTLTDTSGTGASGTVSLNGGPVFTWTNADTDLRVVGPNGEVVYLNTTAITPGFSGTVAITADGTLSLDGGVTTTPITFSPNQQLTDAQGRTIFLDTTAVRRTGTDWVEFPNSYGLFDAFIALRDDLENVRGLSPTQQAQAISRSLDALDSVHARLLHFLGEQSATLAQLETLEQHLQDTQVELRSRLGELEEADLAELVVRLQAQQNQLLLVLGATAQVLQPSLLDFLR
jgi:flagellar hook-associated protein 3 FlgL